MAATFRWTCPCGVTLRLPVTSLGKPFFCPSCGTRTVLAAVRQPTITVDAVLTNTPALPAAEAIPPPIPGPEPAPDDPPARPHRRGGVLDDYLRQAAIDRAHKQRAFAKVLWAGNLVLCVLVAAGALIVFLRRPPAGGAQEPPKPPARSVSPAASRPDPRPLRELLDRLAARGLVLEAFPSPSRGRGGLAQCWAEPPLSNDERLVLRHDHYRPDFNWAVLIVRHGGASEPDGWDWGEFHFAGDRTLLLRARALLDDSDP